MQGKRHTYRERFDYWFDNKMAQGFWPKVRLLLLVTFVFVAVVGFLAVLASGDVEGSSSQRFSPAETFLRTLMYAIGKGGALTIEADGSPDKGASIVYLLLMLVTILYCMFMSAILIGLINNALRSKVDELGTGQSQVIEEGHILILGFNDALFALIGELIESDLNHKHAQTLVVLDKTERSVMVEAIRRRFGTYRRHRKNRIICMTGSIYGFEDLKRCSIETCSCIVVNASNDFDTVKAVMACSHVLDESGAGNDPYIVAAIFGEENELELRVAAQGKKQVDRIDVLSLNEVLARIMVHTSRQPGLADVFTELFNFTDDEFYIFKSDPNYPALHGRTISEINHLLQMSYAVGVEKREQGVVVGPPNEVVFEPGDSLVVLKENDEPLVVSRNPGKDIALHPVPIKPDQTTNVLLIGMEPIADSVLMEYANYLASGSTIHIAESKKSAEETLGDDTITRLEEHGISLCVHRSDARTRAEVNRLLVECDPDCVLVLANYDDADPVADDERIVRTLLYLREYRNSASKRFSITSEMHLADNKELLAATEPDDFIIGRQFAALLMAQISKNRSMSALFEDLLSSVGFEVYMKPASWYAPLDEPVDLISVGQVAADRGEVFIGMRQMVDGRYKVADINPLKYENDLSTLRQYTFSEEDYVVVLSEDSAFHHRAAGESILSPGGSA